MILFARAARDASGVDKEKIGFSGARAHTLDADVPEENIQ